MTDGINDLTPSERAEFARLERTIPLDATQEERTVRALYDAGLLGAQAAGGRGASSTSRVAGAGRTFDASSTRRYRPLRVALAIAAGLGCFLAGRWSERAGLWGQRAETVTGPNATRAVLADSQRRAPVIRF